MRERKTGRKERVKKNEMERKLEEDKIKRTRGREEREKDG